MLSSHTLKDKRPERTWWNCLGSRDVSYLEWAGGFLLQEAAKVQVLEPYTAVVEDLRPWKTHTN